MSKLSDYQHSRGFTLIEVLFSLSIMLMIVYSSVLVYRIILYQNTDTSLQLLLGIIQIREELLDVSEIEVTNESLSYVKNEQRFSLELLHHHLIKKPGTDILLRDIDQISFYVEHQSIYLSITKDQKDDQFMISFIREKDEET